MNHPIRDIIVDFDGVLTTSDRWPEIGPPDNEMIHALRGAVRKGYRLALSTCRQGDALDKAIDWCADRGLFFHAINENLPDRIERFGWDCRKISGDLLLDDKCVCWDRDNAIMFLKGLSKCQP